MKVYVDRAYYRLVHRWIDNVGPKSIAKMSEDSHIPAERIDKKDLSGEEIMTLWGLLFGDSTFLEANATMDGLKFDPMSADEPRPYKT